MIQWDKPIEVVHQETGAVYDARYIGRCESAPNAKRWPVVIETQFAMDRVNDNGDGVLGYSVRNVPAPQKCWNCNGTGEQPGLAGGACMVSGCKAGNVPAPTGTTYTTSRRSIWRYRDGVRDMWENGGWRKHAWLSRGWYETDAAPSDLTHIPLDQLDEPMRGKVAELLAPKIVVGELYAASVDDDLWLATGDPNEGESSPVDAVWGRGWRGKEWSRIGTYLRHSSLQLSHHLATAVEVQTKGPTIPLEDLPARLRDEVRKMREAATAGKAGDGWEVKESRDEKRTGQWFVWSSRWRNYICTDGYLRNIDGGNCETVDIDKFYFSTREQADAALAAYRTNAKAKEDTATDRDPSDWHAVVQSCCETIREQGGTSTAYAIETLAEVVKVVAERELVNGGAK